MSEVLSVLEASGDRLYLAFYDYISGEQGPLETVCCVDRLAAISVEKRIAGFRNPEAFARAVLWARDRLNGRGH